MVHGPTRRDHVSQHIVNTYYYGYDMGQRRFMHMSFMIYKSIKLCSPIYLHSVVVKRGKIHQVNTRHRQIIDIPRHRTVFFQSCFYYLLAHAYNLFPEYFLYSFVTFKKVLENI